MTAAHDHAPPPRPTAAAPTLPLLRLSAGARVLGAGAVVAVLWILVLVTIA